jgi:hypothetical protein
MTNSLYSKFTNRFYKIFKNNNNALAFLVGFFCVSALIYLCSFGLSGNDFWWHVKAGEWIVSHKSVPTNDIFSWYGTSHGFEWISHEWLSEVIFYGLYHLTGTVGVFVVCLVLSCTFICITAYINRTYFSTNILYTVLLMLCLTLVVSRFFYGRPHIFSFYLMFIVLAILYKYCKPAEKDFKGIYFLPVIAIIWSNLHGGSSNLVYLLPVIFLVAHIKSFKFGKLVSSPLGKTKWIKLLLVTISSMLCICINPHGVSMLLYPFTNMADKTMLSMLSEWQAPDAKDLAILILCFLPLILLAINIISTNKEIDLADFFIFGFFTFMMLRSQRFISLLMISSVFYGFKYAVKMPEFNKNKVKASFQKCDFDSAITFTMLSILFGAFVILGIANTCNTNKSENGLISTYVSHDFIELVKSDSPERLFNSYDFGGTLIYNDIPVFVDGRADVYSGKTLDDYNSLHTMTWSEDSSYSPATFVTDIINKYNFDAYLVDVDSSLYFYLCEHSETFELIKEEDNCAYFRVR